MRLQMILPQVVPTKISEPISCPYKGCGVRHFRLHQVVEKLLALSDWLLVHQVTQVAMESTGEYWKPVFNILEDGFGVILVNAQHISQVPGRKTDVTDAEWIADLLRHGLLSASFIPPVGQRELRALTRERSNLVRERATLVNRVQKTLESANIKLASMASDVMGVSGRAMLDAIIAGQATPEQMAELAKGRLRDKREALSKALEGRVKPETANANPMRATRKKEWCRRSPVGMREAFSITSCSC